MRGKIWVILGLLLLLVVAMIITVAKHDDARMLALVRQEQLTEDEERALTCYYNWEWELTWPSKQFKTEYEARFGKQTK